MPDIFAEFSHEEEREKSCFVPFLPSRVKAEDA